MINPLSTQLTTDEAERVLQEITIPHGQRSTAMNLIRDKRRQANQQFKAMVTAATIRAKEQLRNE